VARTQKCHGDFAGESASLKSGKVGGASRKEFSAKAGPPWRVAGGAILAPVEVLRGVEGSGSGVADKELGLQKLFHGKMQGRIGIGKREHGARRVMAVLGIMPSLAFWDRN